MAKGKKTIIHVNQANIRNNRKYGFVDPVLTVKQGRDNDYCHEAEILVDGEHIGSVVYRPQAPLSCGAVCWIELDEGVEVRKQAKRIKKGAASGQNRKSRIQVGGRLPSW